MKLQASTALGVWSVDDFDEGVQVMSQEAFYEDLPRLKDGATIGADFPGVELFEKIRIEYGLG